MRVALLGGTGFIGTRLRRELLDAGHEVVLLARPSSASRLESEDRVTVVPYDGRPDGAWTTAIDGADAVANLAGVTIGARWTKAHKAALRSSRIDLTQDLVRAMVAAERPPSVLVNASGAGYYGDRGDEVLTEEEPPGDDWLSSLAEEWEAAAFGAESLSTRVVTMRTGIVFGPGGGSLGLMALPFKLYVGGPLGSGRQWFPWIHLDDIAGLYRHAIESESVSGPLNACAGAEREGDVAKAIGRALHRPSWFPTPTLAVRLLYGEFADALSASQRVSTEKARASGYEFVRPGLQDALDDSLR